MTSIGETVRITVFALLIFACGSVFAKAPMTPAQTLNLPAVDGVEDEDETPDVTARVARISFIKGDVQIRHAGSQDWENVTLNLPVVEGDEIATSSGGRIEIQFGAYSHLRLAENGYLTISTLQDGGIAVSVSQGSINIRLTEFDKDRQYFEIDAPKTTIAVQKAGMYRIDAGKQGDQEIRVTASEDGEARVYSDNSGFTLKKGRSARIYVEGSMAGEYETTDASRYADEFDSWSLGRDAAIAKHLRDSYYNKYYDQDIYGADDLSDSGEWVFTKQYGYVWRPYQTATSAYADWSPYRYGHWRWIPPFGWTWVNDEPWGWATYHHGRWLYDSGGWVWSPYGYYRMGRSWWSPALVVISIVSNNVCWYPLGYYHHNYNYNARFQQNNNWNGGHHNGQNGPTGGIRATPTPSPAQNSGPTALTRSKIKSPPLQSVPSSGVVSIPVEDFGTRTRKGSVPPPEVAKRILSRDPEENRDPIVLPKYSDIGGRVGREIKTEKPLPVATIPIKMGAGSRSQGAPLDPDLRKTRMYGNREPAIDNPGNNPPAESPAAPRRTGAVERPLKVREERVDVPTSETPQTAPPKPVQTTPQSEPGRTRTPRTDPDPVQQQPPRFDPPPAREPQRSNPPPVVQEPRRSEPPARQQPSEPPARQQPSEPPARKPEPKPEPKPAPPADKPEPVKRKDG